MEVHLERMFTTLPSPSAAIIIVKSSCTGIGREKSVHDVIFESKIPANNYISDFVIVTGLQICFIGSFRAREFHICSVSTEPRNHAEKNSLQVSLNFSLMCVNHPKIFCNDTFNQSILYTYFRVKSQALNTASRVP